MVGNSVGEIRAENGDGVSWSRGPMIGKGGFGCVYLAAPKKPKSKYSSCFFPSSMAVKSAEVSVSGSIQKEREILGNLKGCPYIIRCFGEETTLARNGAMVYNLLLEYGSAGTLAGLIAQSDGGGGLPEPEVKLITRSLLRGLRHVHGTGYVHCDLKPDNILLVSGPKKIGGFSAKIGDFGLAKRAEQGRKRKLDSYWCGTPMYLSPEAVMEGEQEGPSDIWALGCMVLEMLTGKPPWDGEKKEVLDRIGPGRELPRVPSGVSDEARDFLKGCFVRRPMFRLMAEMLLNHPFVEGLECDDEFGEVEDWNEIESILLVSESDDEFSSFDSSCYWSESDEDEDEIESSIWEERELEVVVNEGVVMGPKVGGFEFERLSKKARKVSEECGIRCPVSFTVPAGL